MNIIEEVEQFLLKYNLLNNKIIVAFSGGYDSMCLLHIINELSKKHNFSVTAIHLNHNWRGEASKQDELNCANFAKEIDVDFFSETLNSNVPQTETSAREERYKFFKNYANLLNSSCILTAHNADDNAETVLYRLAKGTGTKGLEGIQEKRDIFYRPLLNISREEIEHYCNINNLNPNIDSSNADTKYKRNLIRHKIIPLLEQINPNAKKAINSLSGIAAEENEFFENLLNTVRDNENKIITDKFNKLDDSLKKRVIHNIFREHNLDYDKDKIKYILNFLEENKTSKAGKRASLTADLWLFINSKYITLVENKHHKPVFVKVNQCGKYEFDEYIFSIQSRVEASKFPKDSDNIAVVDLSNFELDFTLRNRQDGDIIQPLGMHGSQKLKKYLNEKKVPNHIKNTMLFLYKDNEILWAPSLGINEKIKVVNKPTHVIKLEKKY